MGVDLHNNLHELLRCEILWIIPILTDHHSEYFSVTSVNQSMMSMFNDIICGLVLLSAVCGSCLAALPFGSEHGDRHLAANSPEHIELPLPVYVDEKHYGKVQVHPSGYISLREPVRGVRVFQHPEGRVVASVDGDVGPFDVYARTTNDSYVGKMVTSIVERKFGNIFVPEQTLVTTWINAKCKRPPSSELKPPHTGRSVTQCVVTTDGYQSYALYFGDSVCKCEGSVGETTVSCSKESNSVTAPRRSIDEVLEDMSVAVQLNPPATRFSPDGDNSTYFFQLKFDSDLCLTLSTSSGSLVPCTDGYGNVTSMTVYRVHGPPGSQQIELFGSGQCLDREHCHSSTSNLRKSDCDHCGAIHWAIESDGTLTEDEGKNCVYVVSGTSSVAVHHSSDGCTKFDPHVLGDRIQLWSTEHGDCLAGSVFENCSSAPQFMVYGLPGSYQIRDTASGYCLDREHCHSSTSNLRLYNCNHCGAIHWSMVEPMLGEDDMQNCVNRGPVNSSVMKHCSEGSEKMAFEVIPQNHTTGIRRYNHIDVLPRSSPKSNLARFIGSLPIVELSGLRLFRDESDGTTRFEVVHSLPVTMEFPLATTDGVYRVEYWVTDIATKMPHEDSMVPGMVLEWVGDSSDVITGMKVRYGAVDVADGRFSVDDGVLIGFVKSDENDAATLPGKEDLLHKLLRRPNGSEWWRQAARFHYGTYNQTYYNFVKESPIYRSAGPYSE